VIPHINYHAYLIPGLVDEAVVRKQAEDRRDDYRNPEVTVVHRHQEDGTPMQSLAGCTELCMIYEPGYETRPVGRPREQYKIKEEA